LIRDEEGHIDFLETQLHLLETVGETNYSRSQAGFLEEGD